jgi:hypothetical protein
MASNFRRGNELLTLARVAPTVVLFEGVLGQGRILRHSHLTYWSTLPARPNAASFFIISCHAYCTLSTGLGQQLLKLLD